MNIKNVSCFGVFTYNLITVYAYLMENVKKPLNWSLKNSLQLIFVHFSLTNYLLFSSNKLLKSAIFYLGRLASISLLTKALNVRNSISFE